VYVRSGFCQQVGGAACVNWVSGGVSVRSQYKGTTYVGPSGCIMSESQKTQQQQCCAKKMSSVNQRSSCMQSQLRQMCSTSKSTCDRLGINSGQTDPSRGQSKVLDRKLKCSNEELNLIQERQNNEKTGAHLEDLLQTTEQSTVGWNCG
jgi:hypothetical protein